MSVFIGTADVPDPDVIEAAKPPADRPEEARGRLARARVVPAGPGLAVGGEKGYGVGSL
jgi:hypothetical protein